MDAARLRAEFPVFERVAYLNAGTCGPLPAAARHAAAQLSDLAEVDGRRGAYFERTLALQARQRETYAALLGATAADVALTTSTSEGIVRVVAGLGLGERRRDPHERRRASRRSSGPLLAARERFGVTIRAVPLRASAGEVSAADAAGRLLARRLGAPATSRRPSPRCRRTCRCCSTARRASARSRVDVAALGCAFYAGSGQKWLCGPVGTGMLYVAPAWRERLAPIGPTYIGFAEPTARARARGAARRRPPPRHPGARRPSCRRAALAAPRRARGVRLGRGPRPRARTSPAQLADAARRARPSGSRARGDTTLVAWEDADPPATRDRLAAAGVAVRDLPGHPYLRASRRRVERRGRSGPPRSKLVTTSTNF